MIECGKWGWLKKTISTNKQVLKCTKSFLKMQKFEAETTGLLNDS